VPILLSQTTIPVQSAPPPLLGNANTVANYHEYYQTLIKNGFANGAASNAYLTASYVPAKSKCIIMKYKTKTLYIQKHAVWLSAQSS
jgi:hypothetical protein